jgi:beta-glucosidase
VLLQNAGDRVLPLRAPAPDRPVRVYTLGFDASVVGGPAYGGYAVTAGDRRPRRGQHAHAGPAGTDYVLIRVEVTNPRDVTSLYSSRDERPAGW